MIIGVIGAMEEEVALLKAKLEQPQVKTVAGLNFFSGVLGGKNVVVVKSGIGKVNAAICAQVLICCFGANYVINTGVAGGLNSRLNIGDIVVSADLVQHDMDATHFGHPRGAVPQLNDGFFKADAALIRLAVETGKQLFSDNAAFSITVTKGRVATGDCFVCDPAKHNDIHQTFNADCVEMEGAAIAQTCFSNKVPFVVIRAVSDKAGENANSDFAQFVKQSSKNASDLVERMISQID